MIRKKTADITSCLRAGSPWSLAITRSSRARLRLITSRVNSDEPHPRRGTGALVVTIASFLATIGCMLGLIFAIPRYVNDPKPYDELVAMWIWGGASVICTVVFCVGLMHWLRARRGIRQ